jgi:cyclophilin family peptidyl-prolyl cis-trans isomerase
MSKKKALKKSDSKSKKVSKNIDSATTVKEIKATQVEMPVRSDEVNSSVKISQTAFWDSPENVRKVIATVVGLVVIALFVTFSFYLIPQRILTETDSEVAKRKADESSKAQTNLKASNQDRIEAESSVLRFDSNKEWLLSMNFKDFGEIKINTKIDYAPKTVESFVRLAYRNYFNGSPIHRIVEQDNFKVIQGGDGQKQTGEGGQSAFYLNDLEQGQLPDELWSVPPSFAKEGEENKLTNEPKFRDSSLYADFNSENGTVSYRKGLILMAKTNQPNTATSQFFITLDKTVLPAEYTVFGVIEDSSFSVLDKISEQVNPQSTDQNGITTDSEDGAPNKPIIVDSVKIISPII